MLIYMYIPMQKINSKQHLLILHIQTSKCVSLKTCTHMHIHPHTKICKLDMCMNKHKYFKHIHYTFLTVHKQYHPNSIWKQFKDQCKNHQWKKKSISLHCKCLLNVNADILLLGRTFVCMWNFMIKSFKVPGFSR